MTLALSTLWIALHKKQLIINNKRRRVILVNKQQQAQFLPILIHVYYFCSDSQNSLFTQTYVETSYLLPYLSILMPIRMPNSFIRCKNTKYSVKIQGISYKGVSTTVTKTYHNINRSYRTQAKIRYSTEFCILWPKFEVFIKVD